MKLVKRKNKNQKSEHRVKRNKFFIISIIAVILVSIFLYPVVMKNPHIRNIERLIEDEVEDNEFTLECNSKRGRVIEQISVNGDEEIFSEKGVCEKIDKIQKIIYQYILENPSAFNLQYESIEEEDPIQDPREARKVFSLFFVDVNKADYCRIIFSFQFVNKWEKEGGKGFPHLYIMPEPAGYSYKFSELSNFIDVKELCSYEIEIDKPELLNNMEGLREIYLAECTGDIEGLKEKAKEMNIECEIEQ